MAKKSKKEAIKLNYPQKDQDWPSGNAADGFVAQCKEQAAKDKKRLKVWTDALKKREKQLDKIIALLQKIAKG